MHAILNRICEGEGKPDDIDVLKDLATGMADGSLCALGTSAPNPVLTTLEYFKDEYEAHIHEKKCPAKVCRALISYAVIPDKCTGCTACATICPVGAVAGEKKQPHAIDPDICIKCGLCEDACKFNAIAVT
jgi:NAD-dependent dihydropyrimidine dehydrogenase PreA subunit